MKNGGRLWDVYIKDHIVSLEGRTFLKGFIVYADEGMADVISSTPGVIGVSCFKRVVYHVEIDPRWDSNWIARELEARIKCNLII